MAALERGVEFLAAPVLGSVKASGYLKLANNTVIGVVGIAII